jgi:hypothetical protein
MVNIQSTITDLTQAVFDHGVNPFNESGFAPIRNRSDAHTVRVAEASQLWQRFMEGRIDPLLMKAAFNPQSADYVFHELHRQAPHVFHESMSTSDFGSLTADVMRAVLLANYAALPATYPLIARVNRSIQDFRLLKRYYTDGGESTWEQAKEGAPFTRKSFDEAYYSYSVKKYRAGFGLTWEAMISDVLGIFQDTLARLAQGGRDTIEDFVTRLYCDTNGPHASFYTAGNGNIITSNPVLTQDALTTALGQIWDMKTAEGRPIGITMVYLVVGSGAMLAKAKSLKLALFGETTNAPGASGNTLRIPNWQSDMFQPVFNPFIANVCGATNAARSWWLFASPSVTRPAMEVGFMAGYDGPQLYRKAPNAIRVGGGVDTAIGDFDTMTHEFMGVEVFGGTRLSPKATMASNGTGS